MTIRRLLCASLAVAGASLSTAKAADCVASARLVDIGEGVVQDMQSGLQWRRCALGQTYHRGLNQCRDNEGYYSWRAALNMAISVNSLEVYAGHSDWRLPNIKELSSLMQRHCSDVALPEPMFSLAGRLFWTSTPSAHNSYVAYAVDVQSGSDQLQTRDRMLHVLLVRSGRQ